MGSRRAAAGKLAHSDPNQLTRHCLPATHGQKHGKTQKGSLTPDHLSASVLNVTLRVAEQRELAAQTSANITLPPSQSQPACKCVLTVKLMCS